MPSISSGAKTPKSRQTKKRIVRDYLALMQYKRWDKITVKELCQKTGITRGTFYLHFTDIYGLMEQIQDTLLSEISQRYDALQHGSPSVCSLQEFPEKFDCEPPQMLISWFDFCKEHKTAMRMLLDPEHGDSYFEKKLKNILTKYVHAMMDADGQPHDELRTYFVRIFTELHFLAARTWLSSDRSSFLSVGEIVNLLNTMRVGGAYLNYRRSLSAVSKSSGESGL